MFCSVGGGGDGSSSDGMLFRVGAVAAIYPPPQIEETALYGTARDGDITVHA